MLQKLILEWAGRKRIAQYADSIVPYHTVEDSTAVLRDISGKEYKVPIRDKKMLFLTLDIIYGEWVLSEGVKRLSKNKPLTGA